jgi:hypothetical protein
MNSLENAVFTKFAQKVAPGKRDIGAIVGMCTGGYSSPTNSLKGTPYALAIFVTVGI